MKTFTCIFLTVVILSTISSLLQAATTTQYMDIDTVIIIYKHFFFSDSVRMDLSIADVQTIKDEVERVREFIWRASNLKCHMNILD